MTPERWQQVETLYHAALECTPAERQAFLNQNCSGDADLQREVESLLAQPSDDGALARPAWEGAESLLAATSTQLVPGAQLGPYRIEASIGAGGMGEVYKARDTRLGRAVAIKVTNPQFIARFEREARAISALNHSNICTLHDVGPNYLVMELCEGETLAALLKRGKLSINDTLRYGAQIADALAAAHAKGIVHRDLKPGNVMVTKAGVKVLDFGLAKSPEDETITASRVVMGTPAYMAPEQLEGKECDARTDIFACGLVLFEMVTGRRIVQGQPASIEGVPEKLAHVIERCLAKDPDDRWQSARDLKAELKWIAEAGPEVLRRAEARPINLRWAAVGILVSTLTIGGLIWWRTTRPAELKPLVRLDVDLATDVSVVTRGASVILAPDGNRLVYVSQNRLFTRRLDQPKASELAGTEGAYAPFFSPDGQWVAFFGQGKLKKIAVEGGAAVVLCDAPLGGGGSWGEDGIIVASVSEFGQLSRIPSAGGTPSVMVEHPQNEGTQRWPQILPGGKAVLFTAGDLAPIPGQANIEVMTLGDRRSKIVVQGGTYGRYLPSGHLVYVNAGTLFAVPFKLDILEVSGTPVPMLEHVSFSPIANGGAQVDFSKSGAIVYRSGEDVGQTTVQWMDSTGTMRPLLAKPGYYGHVSLSPDGTRLALDVIEGFKPDIWLYEWKRDTMTRLTSGGDFKNAIWSPDGRYILFGSSTGMYWTRADGSGSPQLLIPSKRLSVPWSFTPDGKQLAYQQISDGTYFDIWTAPIDIDATGLRAGKPNVYIQTSVNDLYPAISPDGRWIGYSSEESGTKQIYVRSFRGDPSAPRGKLQISGSGGSYLQWSRVAPQVFFWDFTEHQIMVVNYSVKGDSFVADKPQVWSATRLTTVPDRPYDLAPDGKSIVALIAAKGLGTETQPTHVVFLENFFDELRWRVPTGK